MAAGTGPVEPELGLLVVWTSDQAARERILDHARMLFDVRRVDAVRWTPARVAENCARFNRPGLRPPSGAGDPGPLLIVTVGGGAALGDRATKLRARAGSQAQVHASVSGVEAARDLVLLLGTDPRTHLAGPSGGTFEEVSRDLTGAGEWASASQLFHVLNHSLRYLILRNFERMPESLHVDAHEDVDLLTDDCAALARVLNARPNVRCIPGSGGPHWVRIGGQDVWFDLRFVGDGYFDPKWASALLDRRVWNARGFYVPNDEDYFESLAYHTIVHKRAFAPDYGRRLAAMAHAAGQSEADAAALHDPVRVKEAVDAILVRRRFRYCRPRDVNVFYNFEAIGHRWPRLRRKLAGLARKALRVAHRLRRAPGAPQRSLGS